MTTDTIDRPSILKTILTGQPPIAAVPRPQPPTAPAVKPEPRRRFRARGLPTLRQCVVRDGVVLLNTQDGQVRLNIDGPFASTLPREGTVMIVMRRGEIAADVFVRDAQCADVWTFAGIGIVG